MRVLVSLMLVFLLCAPIYAQFEAEFFKVGEELVVREEFDFSWQNQDDLVYLGSLKMIPSNRPIPSLKNRDNVMNKLLNQFLANAIDKARVQQEDTVFRDGFVLDQELTAVAVRYEVNGPYEVEVALRLVETEEKGELPITITGLMTRLLDCLNEVQGPGHTLSKIGIEENIYYDEKYDTETHVIRKNGRTYFEIDVITQEKAFTENLDEYATHQGYEGRDQLILDMFLPNSPLKEWRNNLSGPNDKYLRVYQNELTSPFEEIVKGLRGAVTNVSSAKKSLIIDSLQRAREWGQYDFINDYIRREVRFPNPDRDILYLSSRDPIFVQDSVLDIFVNRRFQNVSSQPVPVSLRQWVLPELLHRWERGKPLGLVDTVKSVSPNSVCYQFDGEEFSVAVQPNRKGELRFRYILGLEQMQEKETLLSLLSKFDIPEREPITIRQVGDHVLLLRPDLGDLLVELWHPDSNTSQGLGKIPKGLSPMQQNLALDIIIDRFETHPDDCGPSIFPRFDREQYEDNQLMISFNDKDRLYFYERLNNGKTRKLTIVGGQNIEYKVSFYKALLRQDSLQGELNVYNIEGVPVVSEGSGSFWFLADGSITHFVDFQMPNLDLETWGEVLNQLMMAYPDKRDIATIRHLASDISYAAVSYEKRKISGIVSVANPLDSILFIDGYSDFANNEKLSKGIVEHCMREGVYQNLSIYGAVVDPSWIIRIGEAYFLANEQTAQLICLGTSYKLSDIQRRAFIDYLTEIAQDSEDMIITMMEVTPSYRILGFRGEPNQARIFFSDGRDMKLSGSINQFVYFEDKDLQQQLIATFPAVKQVKTEEFLGVRVSETPGRLALWDSTRKIFHEPSVSVPSYLKSQRSRVLTEVLKHFKNDETVSLEFKSDVSTMKVYGIHNPAEGIWSYVPLDGSELVRIRKQDAGQSIEIGVVDVVLKQESTGSVRNYTYVNKNAIPFLRDSHNNLVRLKDERGMISWSALTNLGDLDGETSPELYDELLDYLSKHTELRSLSNLSFLQLNVHDVVVWKKEDTFTTISHNKKNGSRYCFEQSYYHELLEDTLLLDRYFGEEAKIKAPEEVDVCKLQDEFSSIYNPVSKLWIINNGGNVLKEFKLRNQVFGNIKNTSNNITRHYLLRALWKFYSPNPDIYYSDKGFFYYHKSRVIFYFGVQAPGSTWSMDISTLKEQLELNIGVKKASKFKGETDNNKIIKLIFITAALNGKNYCTVYSLTGEECITLTVKKEHL